MHEPERPDRLQDAVVAAAIATLTASPRWSVADLSERLEALPGLYAVFGTHSAWGELGLSVDHRGGPLYVGKAEGSFISRDLKTHFSTGKTGQSTIRRSFAALLHDSLRLTGVPRNPNRPGHFANYGLSPADDERLTEWMRTRLSLAVWPKPNAV